MSKRKQRDGLPARFQRKFKASSEADRPAAASRAAPSPRHKPGAPEGEWIFGLHPVLAALANPARDCLSLAATTAGAAHLPADSPLRPQIMESDSLARRLPPGAVHQGLALQVAPLPELSLEEACAPRPGRRGLVVVLDQVTDPHNVGAILRSAAAFGADAVVVTERHAPHATGTLAKAASGALEHVPLVRVVNLARALDALAELGYWRVGLAEEGPGAIASLPDVDHVALIMGAEGSGLRRLTREHCDLLAHLPIQGPISSLNVSNAAAVALYAVTQRSGPRGVK